MARRSRMKRSQGHPAPALEDQAGSDTGPSKTALKAEDHARQELGVALAELPTSRLAALEMPEELRQAIREYRSISAHGAKKRQRKFLGRLMRNLEVEPFEQAVEDFRAGRTAATESFQIVERWRDALVADDEAITRWMAEHPESDSQRLRSLVRAARRQDAATTPEERHGRAYRELFAFLRRYLAGSA